ncbi:hypothetical protein R3P38DRAFT_3189138 [Favolaschia claudopus]|uniref:Uncharacterized protein n=1 Tax=Favolaschia claudopus TaxID=2862362 RepID=A0AAW0BU18_9AGAR
MLRPPLRLSSTLPSSILFPCQTIPRRSRPAVTHTPLPRPLATSSFTGPAAFATYASSPALPVGSLISSRVSGTSPASASTTSTSVHSYAALRCGCRVSDPVLEGTHEWVERAGMAGVCVPSRPLAPVRRYVRLVTVRAAPVFACCFHRVQGMGPGGWRVEVYAQVHLRLDSVPFSSPSMLHRVRTPTFIAYPYPCASQQPHRVMPLPSSRESHISLAPASTASMTAASAPMTSTPLPSKEAHLTSLLPASLAFITSSGVARAAGRQRLRYRRMRVRNRVDGGGVRR